jgi:hypothetical protein
MLQLVGFCFERFSIGLFSPIPLDFSEICIFLQLFEKTARRVLQLGEE